MSQRIISVLFQCLNFIRSVVIRNPLPDVLTPMTLYSRNRQCWSNSDIHLKKTLIEEIRLGVFG